MAGLPMLLSRIVLLDGCIVFSNYLLVVIGLENSRNDRGRGYGQGFFFFEICNS